VPVIVVPIVLTTQTVTLKMGSSGGVLCSTRITPGSACCVVADSTKGPTATGAPLNVSLVVHNPNYRSATATFTMFVNGTLRTISAPRGWMSGTSYTLAPKVDTTVWLAIPVYYSESDSPIDPFIIAQVCDYTCTTNCSASQPSTATIFGHMATTVGSISTQNLNFNYLYNFP